MPARTPRPQERRGLPRRSAVLVLAVAALAGAVTIVVRGPDSPSGPSAANARTAAPPESAEPGAADRAAPSPVTTGPPTTLRDVGTHSARLDDLHTRSAPTPTRIRVGDIELEAPVAPAGVADDGSGELEVPSRADAVVWYRFGPSPGSAGSAVVAGHVDYDGARGSFFRLTELRPGSPILVAYDDGSERRFRVTERRRIAKAALPTDEIFSRKGPPRLNLITCGGAFDPSERSYRDNVVVSAVPVAP